MTGQQITAYQRAQYCHKNRITRYHTVCAQIHFNLSQEMRRKLAGTVV